MRTSKKWIGQFWEMYLRWLAKNRCSFCEKNRFPKLKWKSSKLSYKFETAVHPSYCRSSNYTVGLYRAIEFGIR